jgi:hypothetical protein
MRTTTILDWLEQRASRLAAVYCWLHNRLTGTRCFAQGCGRLLLRHTPRQLDRCYSTPLAIELTERGWLHGHGITPLRPVLHHGLQPDRGWMQERPGGAPAMPGWRSPTWKEQGCQASM